MKAADKTNPHLKALAKQAKKNQWHLMPLHTAAVPGSKLEKYLKQLGY